MVDPNRHLLETAVRLLEPLLDELVFVGGCTTGLFVTDPAAGTVRATRDVDAVVDVASRATYYALSDRLRALGLREDTSEDAPLCRWRTDTVVLDVMPTDAVILGFSNRWYPLVLESAQRHAIAGHPVRVISPPLFVATKLVAFHGRGRDIVSSHDLEDIVAIVDGRAELLAEVAAADVEARTYIAQECGALLANRHFREVLPGLLLPDLGSQARIPYVQERLAALAALA